MEKLKVNKLQKGDTIGFLIPSFANKVDKFKKIEDEINALGYKVKFGKTCYLKHGYLAGTDLRYCPLIRLRQAVWARGIFSRFPFFLPSCSPKAR